MKRIFLLSTLCLCLISATAQKGLNIAIYFSVPYLETEGLSHVHIEGNDLVSYNLSLFRSIRLTPESTPDNSRNLM